MLEHVDIIIGKKIDFRRTRANGHVQHWPRWAGNHRLVYARYTLRRAMCFEAAAMAAGLEMQDVNGGDPNRRFWFKPAAPVVDNGPDYPDTALGRAALRRWSHSKKRLSAMGARGC